MKPFRQITNIRRLIRVALLAFTVIWILPNANADFTFTPGHIYSTFREIGNTQDIIEYSETGTVLGSLTPPSLIEGDELHGIAFGADGFLYAVKVHFAESGFSVLVLDSSGTVHAAYTMGGIYYGNLSYGKIALDQQYIYVAGGDDLVRFTVGSPNSGVSIYTNNQVFDVKILPNGHLFVAHAYGIDEITNAGTIVRSISLIGADFVDVRGIEYDPAIDKLFVTELGYTNFEFRLMRINASTGVLENSVYFVYGDDLFLTQSNTLLVGSRTETPRIYNENCEFLRTLGTAERMFVTQYISIVIPPPVSDFNRDGKPDYVLYNASTRRTAVWYMDDTVFLGGAYGPTLPAGWRLVDVADFDGDGNPDYALFNPSTRQTAIWYLSAVAFVGGAYGPTLPSGWALVATADFNGNGKPDYVLYNSSTRQTAVWYMSNNVFAGAAYGPILLAGWSLVGVADFNRDGKTDYLLFNASTHQSAIWYLSGGTVIGSAYGPTIASGYQVTGAADFDGDGSLDYVLYSPSTQRTALWYLYNYALIGGAYGPTLPAGWSLVRP